MLDIVDDLLDTDGDELDVRAASKAVPPLLATLARCYAHHACARPLPPREAQAAERVAGDLRAVLRAALI
jgi:hypothetical protein